MNKLSEHEGRTWAGRLADPPAWPDGRAAREEGLVAGPVAGIDDAMAAYIAAMRGPFELLCQAETQLAGLLVLAVASGQAIAGHPMLDLVSGGLDEAADGVRTIAVPEAGRHHHAHILEATRTIGLATTAARRCLLRSDDKAVAAVLAPLRAAHQHLVWATVALPGLEVVALSEACCAQHAGPRRRTH